MQEDQGETFGNMLTALLIAVVFIYLVLASQFESFVHPLTIIVALPFAMVGAIAALFLTDSSVSMGSLIGVILLMGLVTKNGILLVDGALQHVREGDSPREAVQKAGPRRLRPILMTSAAMVLGMLPTALGRGFGSEFRAPMAMVVIGGVITSTMLTLWVVPVVFLLVERLRGHREGGAHAAVTLAPEARPTGSEAP
jgi:multidrug efflux pump subunit AcrB